VNEPGSRILSMTLEQCSSELRHQQCPIMGEE
jgi:hypothetical protein